MVKQKKNVEYLQHLSTNFHQVSTRNDRIESGHLILLTDDLENVGKCKNLQKFSFYSIFPLFQIEWKTKVLWISEITQHFQKCFTDNDSGT